VYIVQTEDLKKIQLLYNVLLTKFNDASFCHCYKVIKTPSIS